MVPNVGHGWAAAAVFWYTLESPASATYSPMTGTAPSSLSAAASAPSVARAALEVSIHAPAAAAWFEHDAARILASCQAGLGVSWVPNDATDGVGLWTVRSGSGADNDTAKWSKPKWDFWKDRWQSLENRTSHGLEGMETAVDAISAAARCAIVAMEKAERKASAKKGGARR